MLTASVYYSSSWVLFSPLTPQIKMSNKNSFGFLSDEDSDQEKVGKEFRPMAFFGKSFSPVGPSE
jgi:hypothetical protein